MTLYNSRKENKHLRSKYLFSPERIRNKLGSCEAAADAERQEFMSKRKDLIHRKRYSQVAFAPRMGMVHRTICALPQTFGEGLAAPQETLTSAKQREVGGTKS